MRELKYHEKKLLKHVDFLNWKKESNIHFTKIMRRYYIQNKLDLKKYNIICGKIKKILHKLLLLKPTDKYRIEKTEEILSKLYKLGLINNKTSLKELDEITVSKFCRRRLSVILFRNKYVESIKEGITFIEQGQIQIGTETILNPALIISREMEDHISWAYNSKIKRKIDVYNDTVDDYDINN